VPTPSSRPSARLVWLFDVDGTLLVTDGAAREAFAFAARECLGVDDDLQGIAFAGRTDPLILADILARHGRTAADGLAERFWSTACARMEVLLAPARGRVLAGVPALLARIGEEPGWIRGLLTGNTGVMAALKLGHYGLADHFVFGAFGDQAADRDALARSAVAHAGRTWGVPPGRCVVVGDTEHDVACARAAGAQAVAVATGGRSRAELERCHPDLLLDDLADPAGLLEWAGAISRGA